MIVRIAIAAIALAATPAIAGTSVADTHVQASAPAGKMAHHAYRPVAPQGRAAVMHTIPAGKINHAATAHNARVAADQAAAARTERLALAGAPAARD